MKRLSSLLLVVIAALTLSACAATTNPAMDHRTAPIGAVSGGPG